MDENIRPLSRTIIIWAASKRESSLMDTPSIETVATEGRNKSVQSPCAYSRIPPGTGAVFSSRIFVTPLDKTRLGVLGAD